MTTLVRSPRPRARLIVLAVFVAGVAALSGCSSSASDGGSKEPAGKATTTVVLDKNCVLHVGDAKPLVGTEAKTVDPPKLEGIQPPIARCAFGDGDRMVQVTVFEGPEMATSIASSLLGSDAEKIESLGSGGACNSGEGTEVATATCVWIHDGTSYVLGLTAPLKGISARTVTNVQAVAQAIDGRLPAS